MFLVSLIIILPLLFSCIHALSDVYNYQLWLDPHKKYSLMWNIDDKEEVITFLAEVRTRGWIGLGLSPNGGMKGSDIVMAWVDDNDGKTYFHDRYATDETLPQIDESQDWLLLDSKQNSTHTIMKFSRPYRTCDKEFDIEITRDTARIIYAYNDFDPKSIDKIKIHGRHERGTKSVLLISQTETLHRKPTEPDLKEFSLQMENITITSKHTTYWCKLFKLPNTKIHVVKYESLITPGNEPYTHHISVSSCVHPDYSQLDKHLESKGSDCSEYANMPKDFKHCTNPFFLWAVGGSALTVPDDIGFPLGDDVSNMYLLLTVHYDNPYNVDGVVDSSGLKFYYTENFRKHEAFTMIVGSAVDKRMFVPPNQREFLYTGHCDPQCYQNQMGKEGLKIFAIRSHAHLTARKIKTRVFRGKKELPWMEDDNHYDFNLQTFRLLKPFYQILPGDQMTVECTYDTRHRNTTTWGGPASREEMCVSVLFYYPRMLNSKPCFSGMSIEGMMALSGVQSVISSSELEHTIQEPKHLQNQSLLQYVEEKQDWSQDLYKQSKDIMLKYQQKPQCFWTKTEKDRLLENMIGYPEVDEIWKPIQRKCKSITNKTIQNKSNPNIILWVFIAIILVNILFINIVFIYVFRNKFVIQFKRMT